MRITRWLVVTLFCIPVIIVMVQMRTIAQLWVMLLLLAVALSVAAILFYPESEFSKRVLELF